MNITMIVNPELGWDSTVATFLTEEITDEQYDRLEEICSKNEYILIDWRSITSVESFLYEN